MICLGEIDSGQGGREGVTVLDHQYNLPHTRLEQLEHSVLTCYGRAGVVNGQDLVPNLDSAVQVGRLVLHYLLDIDPGLVLRLLDQQAQPATSRFDQFHRLHVGRRGGCGFWRKSEMETLICYAAKRLAGSRCCMYVHKTNAACER